MANFNLTKIDNELWQNFKLLCVMEKVSMRKKIEKLIKEEVERAKRVYGRGGR